MAPVNAPCSLNCRAQVREHLPQPRGKARVDGCRAGVTLEGSDASPNHTLVIWAFGDVELLVRTSDTGDETKTNVV